MQESTEFEEIESRLLSDFSFSKGRIVSWLSSESLSAINLRFLRLRNTAKMNFLLAIMHLPKESLVQWRECLKEILAIASRDADDWIQTVAMILSSYVDTRRLYFRAEGLDDQLEKMVKELSAAVTSKEKGKYWDIPEYYVAQNVRRSIYCASSFDNSNTEKKHFNLRKRPKASMDRLECLQRAELVKSQTPVTHPPEATVTCEVDQPGAMMSVSPTEKATKASAQVPEAKGAKSATRKEVAVKMIDLSETPQALRTKRKSTELEEKAAKRAAKEELKKQKEREREIKRQQLSEKKLADRSTRSSTSNVASSSPGMLIEPKPEPSSIQAGTPIVAQDVKPVNPPITAALESRLSSAVPVLIIPKASGVTGNHGLNEEQKTASSAKPKAGPTIVARSLNLNGKSTILRLSTSESKKTLLPSSPCSSSQTEVARATDEIQRSAEIFAKSNCLLPAHRTIINDFMNGKRDASLTDKGVILLLKMDERRANEIKRDGTKHPVLLQTFCRLDYRSGSVGKVLKAKPLNSASPPAE